MQATKTAARKIRPAVIFFCMALIAYLVLAPGYFWPRLQEDTLSFLMAKRRGYAGTLTLWQVDTFPGGQWSRASFLAGQAAAFERANPGVYVQVVHMTAPQARLMLAQGESRRPDVISFGTGMGDELLPLLTALPDGLYAGLEGRLSQSGMPYALPWCYGGYVLYSLDVQTEADLAKLSLAPAGKNVYSAVLPKEAETLPLNALSLPPGALAGEKSLLLAADWNEAWDIFNYQMRARSMLGTQRELYRRQAALEKGKMRESAAVYLTGYTDLVQYAGVIKTADEKKEATATALLAFMVSEKVQRETYTIGMYPALSGAALTFALPEAEKHYKALAGAKVPSVFHKEPGAHQWGLSRIMQKAE